MYPPLTHAEWNGATPTDLVFPFFIFIVGVSIVLAYTKYLERGREGKEMVPKIVKRSFIIFALGIFLALFPEFDFQIFDFPGCCNGSQSSFSAVRFYSCIQLAKLNFG